MIRGVGEMIEKFCMKSNSDELGEFTMRARRRGVQGVFKGMNWHTKNKAYSELIFNVSSNFFLLWNITQLWWINEHINFIAEIIQHFFYLVILLEKYDEKLVAVDIFRTINVYKENDCAKKKSKEKIEDQIVFERIQIL